MRKIKEVLRLKFDVGLGLRQIARSCSIGLDRCPHRSLPRCGRAGGNHNLSCRDFSDRSASPARRGPAGSPSTIQTQFRCASSPPARDGFFRAGGVFLRLNHGFRGERLIQAGLNL